MANFPVPKSSSSSFSSFAAVSSISSCNEGFSPSVGFRPGGKNLKDVALHEELFTATELHVSCVNHPILQVLSDQIENVRVRVRTRMSRQTLDCGKLVAMTEFYGEVV